MIDPERQLSEMKPATPSEEFERRMTTLFEEIRPQPAIWQRGIAAWQAAAACLICGFAGFAASNFFQEAAPVQSPEIRTDHDVEPVHKPAVRSAFDLTDPTPCKAAASPAIQVIIETADWKDNS